MMINKTERTSYIWLVLIFVITTFVLFDGGFDNDVVYYGVFIMALFGGIALAAGKESIELNRVIIAFSLFALWALISIFWSVSPIRTLIEGIQLISFGLVYILARRLSSDELDKFMKVLFLVIGGIAITSLIKYLFISGGRIQATFPWPNPFAIFMVMMFLVALGMFIRNNSKLCAGLSILFLVMVLSSGSRASWIAMLISLFIVFLGIEKTELKKAVVNSLIVIVAAVALFQILLHIPVYNSQNVSVENSAVENIVRSSSFLSVSVKGRLEFWRVAFELFKNKLLTGYGIGTYYSAYYAEYGLNEWYSRFAHNHYLQIAAELGIIGIVLFLGFLWTGFRSVLFNAKKNDKPIYFWGMVAGLAAFLLHIGVDFSWNYPAVTAIFFFFLGVVTRGERKRPVVVNRRMGLGILVLVFLITAWQVGATRLYVRALELEQSESVDAALDLTQKVNRIYPISSFGWSYESDLLYKRYMATDSQNDLDMAFAAAENAVDREPYDVGSKIKLAKLYKNVGDYSSAEKYYLDATNYSAYVLESFIELGNLQMEKGDNEKAEETLLSALERSPYALIAAPSSARVGTIFNIATVHVSLIKLYAEAGEDEKIQNQVDQLIALKTEYPFLDLQFN